MGIVHEPADDAEVLRASCAHAPSFAAIFDRHADRVHRYLDRRVGRDRADELLGEVFRIAFERRHVFRNEHPSARPWLFGIATNLVARHGRSEIRRLRALARLEPLVDLDDDALASVDARLDASRRLAAVAAALLTLEERDRDVVVLVAWEGLSYDEVAEALSIPVGTVRSRLNRARRRLRELVPGDGDERANPMQESPEGVTNER